MFRPDLLSHFHSYRKPVHEVCDHPRCCDCFVVQSIQRLDSGQAPLGLAGRHDVKRRSYFRPAYGPPGTGMYCLNHRGEYNLGVRKASASVELTKVLVP